MTPEEKEEIIEEVTKRVSDKLVPQLDEWFETFEMNFVDQFVTTFDGYFEDRMKCYVAKRDEELRVLFVKKDPTCD